MIKCFVFHNHTKPLCLLDMVKNVPVFLREVLHFPYFLSSHLSIHFSAVSLGLVVWPSSAADTGEKARSV
jgi:hypothetical protein